TALILLYKGASLVVGLIPRIALGSDGQIDDCLSQGQFAFGAAQPLEGQGSIVSNLHGARIGQTDILPSHANDTTRQITGIRPAVQHPSEPIQSRIRVGTTHRFMQSRNLVIEIIAPLVKASGVQGQGVLQKVCGNQLGARGLGSCIGLLEQVQKTSRIAVGIADQGINSLILKLQTLQRVLLLYAAQQPFKLIIRQGFKYINL